MAPDPDPASILAQSNAAAAAQWAELSPQTAPISCVVTDVDGTLVDSSTRVARRDVEAAQSLIAAGIHVHLATGRNELAASRIAMQLPTTQPAILYNGARLVDLATDEVWWETQVAPSAHERLVDLARGDELNADAVVYSEGEVLAPRLSPAVKDLAQRDGTPVRQIEDLLELHGRSATKWLLITSPARVPELEHQVLSICDRVRTTRSEPGYVEVLPEGVDKGTGLEQLAERCGYNLEQVAAMGDKPNDVPMLRRAGIPIAVRNAHPEVLKVASATVVQPPPGSLTDVAALALPNPLARHDPGGATP